MEGSKYFFPQPCAVLMVGVGVRKYIFVAVLENTFVLCVMSLVWDSKKNQKIQETGDMDDTVFGIFCLFKASGNWDEIIEASSSIAFRGIVLPGWKDYDLKGCFVVLAIYFITYIFYNVYFLILQGLCRNLKKL